MTDDDKKAEGIAALEGLSLPTPACGNCRCYVENDARAKQGECRESPPAATVFPVPGKMAGQVQFITQSSWPVVKADQFCVSKYLPRLN